MAEPRTRNTILAFGAFTVLISLMDKLFGAGYILRMDEAGLDPARISLVLAASSAVLAVVDFPSGVLADLWGRKRTAALGALLVGAGTLWYALASTAWEFLPAIAVWSGGSALMLGAPGAWLVDRLNGQGAGGLRTTVLARTAAVATATGAAAGLAAVPLLADGARPVLLASAGTAFAAAVVLFVLEPDNRGRSGGARHPLAELAANTRDLAADARMRVVLARIAMRQAGFTCFLLSYQLYALNVLGVPPGWIGALLAASIVLMAVGSGLVELLARRIGLPLTTLAGTLTAAAGYGAMAAAGTQASTWFVGLALFQVGIGTDLTAFGSWLHGFVPADRRASWLSACSSVQTLVGIAGTLAAGGLIAVLGYPWVWGGATVVMAASAIPLLLLRRYSAGAPADAPDDLSDRTEAR